MGGGATQEGLATESPGASEAPAYRIGPVAMLAQVGSLHIWRNLVTTGTSTLLIMPIKGGAKRWCIPVVAPTPVWFEGKPSGLSGFAHFYAEEVRARLMRVAEEQKIKDGRRVHFEDEGETLWAKHGRNKIPNTFRENL